MNDTHVTAARESSRHLADLLRREHGALVDFLVALSEFDRTEAHRRLGFANVFDYLHRELRLSRGAAHYRKAAARLVAKFLEVVEPLPDGRLCLTSVVQLAHVMNEQNRAEVLPRFFQLSKREARELSAELRPGVHSVDAAFANLCGYAAGMVNSFVFNKTWTFQTQGNTLQQMHRFLILNILGLALSTLLLFVFVDLMQGPHLLVWFISTGFVMILNFYGNKLWTFADVPQRTTNP